MIEPMRPEQAREVACIHRHVLTESIYTQIGQGFLEYYYRRLLRNPDFICHVHVFNGRVSGFISSTPSSRGVFIRQMRRDALPLTGALLAAVAADVRVLKALFCASRFVFFQHRRMLAEVQGEILSFAVLPPFRASEADSEGRRRPTPFFTRTRIAVAAELFRAALRRLGELGVCDLKIMTGAGNEGSNRFYAKMGCQRQAEPYDVFGEPTYLYYGNIKDLLGRAEEVTFGVPEAAQGRSP